MPPIRTKKRSNKNATTLLALGFVRIDKDEARARAAREKPSPASRELRDPRPLPEPSQAESTSASQPVPALIPAPLKGVNSLSALKSGPKGQVAAYFTCNAIWDRDYQSALGSSTKEVSFGSEFILTDQHIAQLVAIGCCFCKSLRRFKFFFKDVSYNAHNSAEDLTDDAVICLAKACPNLDYVQLQGTAGLGDQALTALFENCPRLTYLELSLHSRPGLGVLLGTALEALLMNPQWCPKLKKLRLPDHRDQRPFMKAMRALSRERHNLEIQLAKVDEYKKWGDWELSVYHHTYRKGREQPWKPVSRW
ncbi:hypothetical protein DL769_007520 [Monosporascus sp. CRB-8-3]|nr:hypothetical protein DL769_007520 [Monosporascus sp. CRB-8-3]